MVEHTAIGFDVGGTNIRAARVSASGKVIDWKTQSTQTEPELFVAQIADLVHQLNDNSVKAIGIGLPGRIDSERQHILSGGYVDLTDFPLVKKLQDFFDGPVLIDNDGNMALIGEQAVGRGQGVENVLMFTIGTGIGGAVINRGKIFRGRATAGQFGHLTVDVNGEQCLCGRRGCVETLSSGTALKAHILAAGLTYETTVEDLLASAAQGDKFANRVLECWVLPLRAAIDSAVAAFDSELVLLGGGLGVSAHLALQRFPAKSAWYQCRIEPAQLGDRAGVIGAGLSALSPLKLSLLKR
jgi:glucokinase